MSSDISFIKLSCHQSKSSFSVAQVAQGKYIWSPTLLKAFCHTRSPVQQTLLALILRPECEQFSL